MTEIFLTIFFISILLFFLGTGIWVAISMIGVSAIGMIIFTSRPVGDAMATTIWGTSSSWTLTALPLFVWMGEILYRTKLSEDLFKALSKLPKVKNATRIGNSIHFYGRERNVFFEVLNAASAAIMKDIIVKKLSLQDLMDAKYAKDGIH